MVAVNMSTRANKLVILAAGLGTRMRRGDDVDGLSARQLAVAAAGVKAMIPVGRPFLDYVLHRAADAECRRVCLVIGPQHDEVRRYYEQLSTRRVQIEFAIQQRPLGTANALAAAEPFVGNEPFLTLNSDNCYPTQALQELSLAEEPAVVAFNRDALVSNSNIAAERIAGFAIIQPDAQGYLEQIQEKPDPLLVARMAPPILVGMNCWRFSPVIFQACRRIEKSLRGEYELPDAVTYSMRMLGERFRVFRSDGPVLDLSQRHDIATVKQRLSGEDVRL